MWIPFTPVWCLTLIRRWLQNDLFGQQTELAAKTSGKFRWRLHVTTRPQASIRASPWLTSSLWWAQRLNYEWRSVETKPSRRPVAIDFSPLKMSASAVSGPADLVWAGAYGWGWGWGWRWFHQIWRHTPNKGWILWACQTEIAGKRACWFVCAHVLPQLACAIS